MSGPRAATVLALLLCLSLVGSLPVALGQDDPDDGPESSMTVVSQDNTSEYLAFRAGERDADGYATGSLDVGAAVSSDAGVANARFTESNLESRLQGTDSDEERAAELDRSASRLDDRVSTLEARHAAAVQAFAAGDIDGRSLVRTLVAIDAEASALDETVVTLYEHSEDLDDSGLDREAVVTLRARLVPLQGPVRDHLGADTRGDGSSVVFAEAGGEDVTLSTVDDGRYLREAYDSGSRDLDGEDELGFNDFEPRLEELYPWASESGPASIGTVGGVPYLYHANVYAAGLSHQHGYGTTDDLVVYVDGSTSDVFYETHRQDASAVPTSRTETVQDGLRMQLERTRAGGPLGVSVVDVDSGDPVDAEVTVDDQEVGATGEDPLWTVAPRGDARVNATHDGDAVSIRTSFE